MLSEPACFQRVLKKIFLEKTYTSIIWFFSLALWVRRIQEFSLFCWWEKLRQRLNWLVYIVSARIEFQASNCEWTCLAMGSRSTMLFRASVLAQIRDVTVMCSVWPYRFMRTNCEVLRNFVGCPIAWDEPEWKYLYHGNQ